MTENNTVTIGCDLGDKYTHVCVLGPDGSVDESARIRTTPNAVKRFFGGRPECQVAFEVGTHSRWFAEQVEKLGHRAIVANAHRVRLIYASTRKNDRLDAEKLARLARVDARLLGPVKLRSRQAHADMAMIHARDRLVQARTKLINCVRGTSKTFGVRLPSCAAKSFHNKVELTQELQPSLGPLLATIEHLTDQIHHYDSCLQDRLDAYPETALVQQVPGVGPITALAFVLLLQDPWRFHSSRDVGAYVGLVSRQRQSGDVDPQLRITKAGNPLVRRLLVQAAHHTLGPFGPDSDLRRFGLRLIERGGKAAKKRAIVAVARKLAVLLHRLWMTGEVYQPIGYSRFEQAA